MCGSIHLETCVLGGEVCVCVCSHVKDRWQQRPDHTGLCQDPGYNERALCRVKHAPVLRLQLEMETMGEGSKRAD